MSTDISSPSSMDEENGLCYSVSEVTEMIQDCLEGAFPPVQIKGEISNFTAHGSGHWYFTLKDAHCQIRAVMFRSANQKAGFTPRRGEGLEVKVYGRIGVYKARGEYQIICQSMEKCGRGALQEEFELLKQKLKQEGLFDRKKPLPFLPRHIVIVSSPTGAAIRDILNILHRRYAGVKVTLVPALVQGEQAVASLMEALEKARALQDADLLIITRGGGSMEDLWAFNNEDLARALFDFPLPVISAVGHEIDFTICDFVSDLRAPTPSAGAELAVQNASDLKDRVQQALSRLHQTLKRDFAHLKDRLKSLRQRLVSPQKKIQDLQQLADELHTALKKNFLQQNQLRKQKLSGLISTMESLSPLQILSRGYCLASQGGKLIKSAHTLKANEEIYLRFSQSFALTRVTKTGALTKEK